MLFILYGILEDYLLLEIIRKLFYRFLCLYSRQ